MKVKKTVSFVLAVLIQFNLCACTQKAPTWEEQYDLGVRYLSDANYEEAIIAFTAAIEIDPRKSESYFGLSDCYIAKEDYFQAIQILENCRRDLGISAASEKIEEMLYTITSSEQIAHSDRGYVQNEYNAIGGIVRCTIYGPNNELIYTQTNQLDFMGRVCGGTRLFKNGYKYKFELDEIGRTIVGFYGDSDIVSEKFKYDGLNVEITLYENYSSTHRLSGINNRVEIDSSHSDYDRSDGSLRYNAQVSEYDEEGNLIGRFEVLLKDYN